MPCGNFDVSGVARPKLSKPLVHPESMLMYVNPKLFRLLAILSAWAWILASLIFPRSELQLLQPRKGVWPTPLLAAYVLTVCSWNSPTTVIVITATNKKNRHHREIMLA